MHPPDEPTAEPTAEPASEPADPTGTPGRGALWHRVAGSLSDRVAERRVADRRQPPDGDPELDALQAAVLAVPGVAELHPGPLGELTEHLPGRRATGLSLTDEEAVVRIVLHDDAPVRTTATAVRDLVAVHTSGSVRVVVADVRGQA